MNPILVYLIIFASKTIEVSLCTLRLVLLTKGEKIIGSIIAFFEISIWLVLAGNVLSSITSDPFKAVAYAFGFVVGNYLGSSMEEKIAMGTIIINIICENNASEGVIQKLQELNVGYTCVDCTGQKEKNKLIISYINRKDKPRVMDELKKLESRIMVSVNESKSISGGHGFRTK